MHPEFAFLLGLSDDKLDLFLVDGDVDFQQPAHCVLRVLDIAEGQLRVVLKAKLIRQVFRDLPPGFLFKIRASQGNDRVNQHFHLSQLLGQVLQDLILR